ncbi:hypothetical protein VPNG_00178 [Cytospora leucostoma]|uniref:Uncharacterized protein n=1 Tax=Cytospora leucostoma TaxID=1230097 RepID=A0A423XNA1_9PEZI|nr:hypothetical protein VPNG_00178 [Cytospora leucostoma]
MPTTLLNDDVILAIAEPCDRQTIAKLMRSNKGPMARAWPFVQGPKNRPDFGQLRIGVKLGDQVVDLIEALEGDSELVVAAGEECATEFRDSEISLRGFHAFIATHALISGYQRSISKAKLENFPALPQTHLLTSKDKSRVVIPEKQSLVAIKELELRELRMTSLLDRGGFMLTDNTETLRLSVDSLDKLKDGLRRAMYIADRLADTIAEPEITRTRDILSDRMVSLQLVHNTGPIPDENLAALRDAEYQAHLEITKAIRVKQRAIIRDLTGVDLALLLTLCEAAMTGWQRYMARNADVDVRFFSKIEAFGELVLREGASFTIWAFVRGTGSLLAHVNWAVGYVAEELWWHGVGFNQDGDEGLGPAVLEELRERFLESRSTDDSDLEDDDEAEQLDADDPMVVKQWAHELVAEAIGCDAWKGYCAGGVVLSP